MRTSIVLLCLLVLCSCVPSLGAERCDVPDAPGAMMVGDHDGEDGEDGDGEDDAGEDEGDGNEEDDGEDGDGDDGDAGDDDDDGGASGGNRDSASMTMTLGISVG